MSKLKTKCKEKQEQLDCKFKEKMPKVHEKTHSSYLTFCEVWEETFPRAEGKVKCRMEKRKQLAKMQREMEQNHVEMT